MNHIHITVLSPHYSHTFHAGRCNFYVDLRCIHSQFCIYFFFLFLHLQNQTHRNNIHNHSRIRMTHAYAIYTQPNTYTHSVYTRIHKEEAYSAEKTRRERKKKLNGEVVEKLYIVFTSFRISISHRCIIFVCIHLLFGAHCRHISLKCYLKHVNNTLAVW